MRKRLFIPFLCACMFFTSITFAQSPKYAVQLAAFDTQVSTNYFDGLTGVFHIQDHNEIHRYYVGYLDEATAESTAIKAKELGYNAYVLDMANVGSSCALKCSRKMDNEKVKSIFFDFDKSNLRGESTRQLDLLFSILNQHPENHVELSAHTDAKGSYKYNKALSMRRAKAAQNYLVNKGIAIDRIRVSTFGEKAPIAKNELENGQDTEEGRQYNRRVELIVYNPIGMVDDVVEDINVPLALRYE